MMDFEEKFTKQGTTKECNEVYWETKFQRNKKTYFKLDNAPMCLRQLYVIPTMSICKVWISIERVSKA